MLNTPDSVGYTDFNSISRLKNAIIRKQSPEALKQVAKQFESMFVNMLLKNMRQAKLGDGVLDNNYSQFYQELYDEQLAQHLSEDSGLGLSDLLVKQLTPKAPTINGATQGNALTTQNSPLSKAATQLHKQAVAAMVLQNQDDPGLNALNSASLSTLTARAIRRKTALDNLEVADLTPGTAKTFALATIDAPPLHAEPLTAKTHDNIKSKADFVTQLLPYAEQAAAELGVEPRALLAQAALETGWGRGVLKNKDGSSSHNLFNLKVGKSWQGKRTHTTTLEFEQGIPKKVSAGFRAYDSYAESFNDYVKFIKEKPRYADALHQVSNPKRYMQALQQAGYATDPQYAQKVMHIYHSQLLATRTTVPTLAMR